jgi:hypothetical protein
LTRHRKLNGAPNGPSGEPWPAKLLPLYESDPALGCLDLENGKVVVYDPERVEDIHGGAWRRSFVTEHESMAGLLEAWLADPCLADQLERRESRCEQRASSPIAPSAIRRSRPMRNSATMASCRLRCAPRRACPKPVGRTRSAAGTG